MKILLLVILIAYITALFGTFYISTYDFEKTPKTEVIEAEYLTGRYINIYRQEHGLPPMVENNDLYLSAAHRAQKLHLGEMPKSHDGYQKIIYSYYGYATRTGENLAFDYANLGDATEAWKKSPSHNSVLLSNQCEYGLSQFKNVIVLHTACKN